VELMVEDCGTGGVPFTGHAFVTGS
jgi:hypothetical protein